MHNHYTIIRQVFFIWHIMLQYTSQNILRELSIKNTNLYKDHHYKPIFLQILHEALKPTLQQCILISFHCPTFILKFHILFAISVQTKGWNWKAF